MNFFEKEHKMKLIIRLLTALIISVAIIACTDGSGNPDSPPYFVQSKAFLKINETFAAVIHHKPGQALATDFDEGLLGFDIRSTSCKPASDTCTVWEITPLDSAMSGTNKIGVYDPYDSLERKSFINIAVLPPESTQSVPIINNNSLVTTTQHVLSASNNARVVVTKNGELWGWGLHDSGLLADTRVEQVRIDSRISKVQGFENIKEASIAGSTLLALTKDGDILGVGINTYGLLGSDVFSITNNVQQIPDLSNVVSIASSPIHALAIEQVGFEKKLYGWGHNSSGELGQGTDKEIQKYRPVYISVKDPVQISAGFTHSVVLDKNGKVWFFGKMYNGFESFNPISQGTWEGFVKIETGSQHILGLKADGTVWAWGANDAGQLGQGNYVDADMIPQRVNGLTQIVDISAKGKVSLALSKEGAVYTWGSYSEPFVDDALGSNVPLKIDMHHEQVFDIEASESGGMALIQDCTGGGSVRTWGTNSNGELGTGAFIFSNEPVLVAGIAEGDVSCDKHFFLYKNTFVEVNSTQLHCNDEVCWAVLDRNTDVIKLDFATDKDVQLFWDCETVQLQGKHAEIPVLDDMYCKVSDAKVEHTPVTTPVTTPETNTYSVKVIIHGGPGAGEVFSSETPQPKLDCINSNEAQTTCVTEYQPGTKVTLSANAFRLNNTITWTGCDQSSGDTFVGNSCQLTMDQNRTVNVAFSEAPTQNPQMVTLNVNASGGGRLTTRDGKIDCAGGNIGVCSASYEQGSPVIIDQIANTGELLQQWSGDDLCANGGSLASLPLTLNSNKSCSAAFTGPEANENSLCTTVSNETGTATPGVIVRSSSGRPNITTSPNIDCRYYPTNTQVTLTPQANPGFAFLRWDGFNCKNNMIRTGDDNQLINTIDLPPDTTCTAIFRNDVNRLGVTFNGLNGGTVRSVRPNGINGYSFSGYHNCRESCDEPVITASANDDIWLRVIPDFAQTPIQWTGCDQVQPDPAGGPGLCRVRFTQAVGERRDVTVIFN